MLERDNLQKNMTIETNDSLNEENEEQLTKGKLFISSAKCPRCGKPMAVSDLPEYAYQCFDCEEDFFAMECNETSWIYEDDKKKVVPEWLISLHDHGEEWYEKHRDVLDAICKKYAVDHVFFDEVKPDHPYVDFGWIQKPSVATIQGLTDEVMALLELGPKGCN